VLKLYGVDEKPIRLLKDISDNADAAVRISRQIRSWFKISIGSRQGDHISPSVFISDLEKALDKIKGDVKGTYVHDMEINNLTFAADVDIIEEDVDKLEETVQTLSGKKDIEIKINVDGMEPENVEQFTYMGSNKTYDQDCNREV
jgi:hypothetical protein